MISALALLTVSPNLQAEKVRVAAYNIEWFGEDANPTRIENLKSVLGNVKADVMGFSEIRSRKALGQILGEEWSVGMTDDGEVQENAVAVRAPFKLKKWEMLFAGKALDFAWPGGRDCLRAEVETPGGKSITVYVLHLKSRGGPSRLGTDARREAAAGMLAAWIKARPEENHVVMGDLNDAPDDRSIRVLATGDLNAVAGRPKAGEPALLKNLFSDLYAKNGVSFGLAEEFRGDPVPPVIPGAMADNDRLRGIEYRYPQDVRVKQVLFDQILVSPKIGADGTAVYAGVDALRGSAGRVRNGEETVKGTLASDHLPVHTDLTLP